MTVHLRQPNVEEHDFGLQLLRCTEGAARTICRGDVVTLKLQHHGEGIRSVLVVIDYQDSARWRRGGRILAIGCTGGLHRGQVHCHSRSPTYPGAVRAYGSAVQVDELLHHGEPDAEASLRAIQGAPTLYEEIKHARQQVGRNPAAAVADRNRDIPV